MNQELQNYITEMLKRGESAETIKTLLLKHGWKQEIIDPYLSQYQQQSLQPQEETVFPPYIPSLFLRIGLAFVFGYAALFVAGSDKIGAHYVPSFVTMIIPIHTFLLIFASFEMVLAVWLLWGKFYRFAGIVAALTLTVITIFNFSDFHMQFRNVIGITGALALVCM